MAAFGGAGDVIFCRLSALCIIVWQRLGLHLSPSSGTGRCNQNEEVVMRNKFRIMVLMVCSSIVLSGCLNYSVNREFGDYYNSTKTIWNDPCIHRNDWFFDVKFGSLGQTVGYSGLFLFVYGIVITGPVGEVIHEVEKVTLSPVVDTLYLPIDLCFRANYLSYYDHQGLPAEVLADDYNVLRLVTAFAQVLQEQLNYLPVVP